MSQSDEFVIENGVLKKYTGAGGEVVIPEGVTEIGEWAFLNCGALTNVTMPEGTIKIGQNAFLDCSNLKSVRIPDNVQIIGIKAFCGCNNLCSLSVPGGLKVIGARAFELPSLTSLELRNDSKIVKDMFGAALPKGLVSDAVNLARSMDDAAFRQYILNKAVWSTLDYNTRCRYLSERGGKSLMPAYNPIISESEADEYGNFFVSMLAGEPSAAACASAGAFLVGFSKKLSDEVATALQSSISNAKNGKKAAVATEKGLADNQKKHELDPTYSDMAKRVLLRFTDDNPEAKTLIDGWSRKLKECYSLTTNELPKLSYSDGKPVEPFLFAYLLVENGDSIESDKNHENGTPWYSQETAEIIGALDNTCFQAALMELADHYLGQPGNSRKLYLAYPICRFADEKTIQELTHRAPQWSSYTSGVNAPPLLTFRRANKFNNSRAAMLFADRYGDLYSYAMIRNTDEDTIRDKFLSDFGLDEYGCKKYDLGNIAVTVRMLSDFSFEIELPDSKTAKTMPKKGTDPEKYEKANNDFSEMKKNLKKVIRSRRDLLFAMFLDGRSKAANVWKESYMGNIVLHKVAELIVWSQGGKTFTLSENGPVNSAGNPFDINETDAICVAHPLEMEQADINAWQRYFVSHGLKQPFEQVWEPRVNLNSIKSDRYKGFMIPYYRFVKNEKHGITVYDNSFHDDIDIYLTDCDATINRIEWERHSISMDTDFEITEISVRRKSRMANHIIAYLDKCTVYDRILKNDVQIVDILSGFTPAQIVDFIRFANENDCTSVTAVLLEYRNNNFRDYDPMDEYILE